MMCMWCCGQVYLLLSCCPCEGRLSGIVDVPNACATLAIPTAIFDQVCLSSPCLLASVMTLMIVRNQLSVLMCKGLVSADSALPTCPRSHAWKIG